MSHTLNQKDYVLFTQLCKLTERGVYSTMNSFLSKSGYTNIISKSNYIMAIGTVPIALVAHMDTVFPQSVVEMYYDRQQNVMWSPDGAGFDDRAGIFAIIKLIQRGFRPTVIFTLGEEIGGLGASELVKDYPNGLMKLKYVIELDRQGKDDCVFYRCKNAEFANYIASFGFKKQPGTFTDISIICPAWGVAGVNLSIGYEYEHSYSELLHIDWMLATIKKVTAMIEASAMAESFEYGTVAETPDWLNFQEDECLCANCRKPFIDYDLFETITPKKNKVQLCIDCLTELAGWCPKCGEPYIYDNNLNSLCYKCREEVNGNQ